MAWALVEEQEEEMDASSVENLDTSPENVLKDEVEVEEGVDASNVGKGDTLPEIVKMEEKEEDRWLSLIFTFYRDIYMYYVVLINVAIFHYIQIFQS